MASIHICRVLVLERCSRGIIISLASRYVGRQVLSIE